MTAAADRRGLSARRRGLLRALLPALAFLVLGSCWALASPPGSSADDDFHLTSIWCAWGNSSTCFKDIVPNKVLVPETVAKAPCFALNTVNAYCVESLTSNLVPTDRFNPDSGRNPQLFYGTLRAFVGPDVNRSVILMRLFNVALAAALLAVALAICRPVIRRAVALAWMVCLVPMGIFFIASTNPSSWVITGVALFWAFLYSAVVDWHEHRRRSWANFAAAALCAVIAVGARSDAALYLTFSLIAVLVLTWPAIRSRRLRVGIVLVPLGLALVAAPFRVREYLGLTLQFPSAYLPMDQPNPLVNTLLEVPSFLAGVLGGQLPTWTQRGDHFNDMIQGHTTPGFSYGVGWTDVANPTLSGILVLVCAAAALFLGFASYSRRKVVAVAFLVLAIVVQIIFMRAAYGFLEAWYLQPRYFIPMVFVVLGVSAIVFPRSRPVLNRGQAVVMVVLLSLADGVSLLATMTRYTRSQLAAYTNIGVEPDWWWPKAPSPQLLFVIAAVAAPALLIALARFPAAATPGWSAPRSTRSR
jgi:hypothetical protein